MKNTYKILSRQHWLILMIWAIGLALPFGALAQTAQPPVMQWQQVVELTYSNTALQGEVQIVKTNDGGSAILTASIGTLIRLSSNGNVNWQVTIPSSATFLTSILETTGLVATSDGGFVILARDTYGWYLAKVDNNGNYLWSKQIVSYQPSSLVTIKKTDLIQTDDGGLLVVGWQSSAKGPTVVDISKYDKDGKSVWDKLGIYYNSGSSIGPDRSSTIARRVIQTKDGGYLVVGSADGNGWAAKLNVYPQGAIISQNQYDYVSYFTDVIPSPYGDGYITVGVSKNGIGTSTLYINPNGSGDNTSGTYRPSGQANLFPRIVNDGVGHHAVLDQTDQNNGDFRLANFTFLNETRWAKTLGGSGSEVPRAIITTDDGGYIIAGTTTSTDGDIKGKTGNGIATWIVKLVQSTSILVLTQPTYSCNTGAITFNTTGGDGSPITYLAPGITRSSATSNSGTVEQGLRNDPKPITIQATQSGLTVSYTFDFKAYCNNPKPPTNGALTLTQPTYDCSTGAITFNTTGGNGTPILYTAPGITRSSVTSNTGVVEQGLRNDPKPITIQATQSGQTVSYTFDFKAYCTNPKPPTSGALTLLAPTYNCTTGAIIFNTSGGDGSTIEYQAAGITGWTTNPNQFVDKDSRTASDVKPFTLMARQSGQVVTYIWDLKAYCGRARVGVAEADAGLSVQVLGNPAHEQVRVRIEGAEGQSLRLRLTDMQGRLLESRTVEQAGASEEQSFRLSPSGPGQLLLQAATDSQQQTVKIIKQ